MTFPVSLGVAVLADFNEDGKLNAAFTGNLIAFGNGDGTFQKPVTLAPGLKAPNVFGNFAAADLNGDGAPDIVSADAFNANVFVLLNNGKGTFTMNIFTGNEVIPTQAVLADVNGDGKQDLVLNGTGGEIAIYFGNGDGTFQTPTACFGLGPSPGLVVTGDLHDQRPRRGTPDVLVPDGSGELVVLLNSTVP